MAIHCYLGIDVGTQGLTALLVESAISNSNNDNNDDDDDDDDDDGDDNNKSSLKVLSIGEGSYDFVPDLPDGCYEQNPLDWETALVDALKKIQDDKDVDIDNIAIEAICVTGQMHGCVMIDSNGRSIGTARLWCDARNQEEVRTVTFQS